MAAVCSRRARSACAAANAVCGGRYFAESMLAASPASIHRIETCRIQTNKKMMNPSVIMHHLGLLCVLNLDGCAELGEDGGRDSTWTDIRAPLGWLPVTMVDSLVVEGGQGDHREL